MYFLRKGVSAVALAGGGWLRKAHRCCPQRAPARSGAKSQLGRQPDRFWISVLADSIQSLMFGDLRGARIVIHELQAQVDGNYVDFDELQQRRTVRLDLLSLGHEWIRIVDPVVSSGDGVYS